MHMLSQRNLQRNRSCAMLSWAHSSATVCFANINPNLPKFNKLFCSPSSIYFQNFMKTHQWFLSYAINEQTNKLEAKDVLPNINRTQGAERAEKCRFVSLVTDLDLWPWHLNPSKRGTKHVFPVNLAQIRSAVPEIFHTQKSHRQRQKQNLTQFTAFGNKRRSVKALPPPTCGRQMWQMLRTSS